MIDEIKVIGAIKEMVKEHVPDFVCLYTDGYVTVDTKRPCLNIESVTSTLEPANKSLLHVDMYFTLTVFAKLDAYGHSDATKLLELRQKVMNLFRCGFLLVDGRALSVSASTGGKNYDEAYIDLQLEFYDNRDETTDTTPNMENVQMNLKKQKG